MKVIDGLVPGPYRPGQEDKLKADVIKAWERRYEEWEHMQVENEEKEPGFPDVISLSLKCYLLTEFKVSDRDGVIEFQKTQPLFYRRHPNLRIDILAWDVPGQRLVSISPREIVKTKMLKFNVSKFMGRDIHNDTGTKHTGIDGRP
jgi:hypothetical protein